MYLYVSITASDKKPELELALPQVNVRHKFLNNYPPSS